MFYVVTDLRNDVGVAIIQKDKVSPEDMSLPWATPGK